MFRHLYNGSNKIYISKLKVIEIINCRCLAQNLKNSATAKVECLWLYCSFIYSVSKRDVHLNTAADAVSAPS